MDGGVTRVVVRGETERCVGGGGWRGVERRGGGGCGGRGIRGGGDEEV